MTQMNNLAFIDSQNMHLSTQKSSTPWRIDMKRLRVYLAEKYHVNEAYLFIGAYEPKYQDMYTSFQQYGYIVVFREHGANLTGKKKGNVDVDIVFHVMRMLHENREFDKVVLVSGDGDYKRMVDYLIKINKFEKLLLPSEENYSSLYKAITAEYYAFMDTPSMRVNKRRGI